MSIKTFDFKFISFCQRNWIAIARFSIAVVFIWFGGLKVLGLSPASNLVHSLFDSSVSFISFDLFYKLFSWFEVLIGILILIPKMTRIVIPLLFLHMITTFGPLILLPSESWSGFMVPTLVGQYIIKNLVIIAVALGISAHLHPLDTN
jgi:uncharacterized membrane protein YkgB